MDALIRASLEAFATTSPVEETDRGTPRCPRMQSEETKMPKRRMTDDLLEQAIALRQRSWSVDAIAAKLDLSRGCISWHLLKEAVDPPKLMQKPRAVPAEAVSYCRNGHTVRPYTPADDAELLRLEAEGLSYYQIGKRTGRRHNSVRGRLMTIARREARLESSAA